MFTPSFQRARLCRGTLDLLGLHGVRVGIGSDGGDTEGNNTDKFTSLAASYIPKPFSESAASLEPAQPMLLELYRDAAERSLTLTIIASLKDPALLLRDWPSLFAAKTKEVVIMGGVQPPTDGSTYPRGATLLPDQAHNNSFDSAAAAFFYGRCQELGVPLVVVARHAAYAAKVPRDVYDRLAQSGSTIGWRLRNAQRDSIEQLWRRACAPADDADQRKGLPARCDRSWFVKAFCGGRDDVARSADEPVWDLIDGFMQYDALAVLAAVPVLRDRHFLPRQVSGPHAVNTIIGEEHHPGVADPPALVALMRYGFTQGLALNHKAKSYVILLVQLRWDNVTDVRLTLVMLRALWGMGVMDCVGILLTLDRSSAAVGHETSVPAPAPPPATAPPPAVSAADDDDDDGVTPVMRANSEPSRLNRAGTSLAAVEASSSSERLGDDSVPKSPSPRPSVVKKLSSTGRIAMWAAGHANIVRSTTMLNITSELEEELNEHAEELSEMLVALGLSHIKVCVDDPTDEGKSASAHLHALYAEAPPVGVTLVVTSTTSAVATFAREEPQLFRERTVRVVHMGGARVVAETAPWTVDVATSSMETAKGAPSGAMGLRPDPAAQNNRLDLESANEVYRAAQRLSVPLTIASRYLAHTCRMPTTLFHQLGIHGGELGRALRDEQLDTLKELYTRACASTTAERRGLPRRCDREWFTRTFCNGAHVGEGESPVSKVSSINLYNPLVLLAALPSFRERYLSETCVPVRSATHTIVGRSGAGGSGVQEGALRELRTLIYTSFFAGVSSNASDFSLRQPLQDAPCTLPLVLDGEEGLEPGRYDGSADAWSYEPSAALDVLRRLLEPDEGAT